MPSRATLVRITCAAFAFGVVAAIAKGANTSGIGTMSQIRSDLGNLSTPWLLVPFIAGTRCVRRWPAALVGLGATVAALTGFYLFVTYAVDLGHHGVVGDLRIEISANRGYYEGGLITGPIFGALGCWWRQSRTLPATIVAGALFMVEPLVLLARGVAGPDHVLGPGNGLPLVVRMIGGWGLSGSTDRITLSVYAAEFAIGLALVAVVGWRRHILTR